MTPSPTVAAGNAGEEAAEEEEEAEEPAAPAASAPPAPAAPTTTSAGIAAPTGPVWGGGLSFAEKLKRAEAEKARLAALPKEPVQTAVASPPAPAADSPVNDASAEGQKGRARGTRRPRGKKEDSAVGEVTEGTEALSVNDASEPKQEDSVPPPPPLVHVGAAQSAEPAQSSPAPAAAEPTPSAPATNTAPTSSEGFLKMGKWEAPVEASEMTAFQFGSFGNAYDDSANNGVSASQVGTNPAATPWTGSVLSEDKTSTNVWGAPEPNLDMSGGLFSQQASTASADLSSSSNAATRAPPGLAKANTATAAKTAPGTNKPKDTAQQAPAAAAPAQTAAYAQGGYTQPPGMRGNANTGAALNAPAAAPAGVYPYPGFDLSQAQFGGYPLGGVAPSAPAAATAASTASTGATNTQTSTSATSAAPNAQQNAAVSQQQAYGGPAGPFPFYNPYYANAGYYYGQAPMFNYGQGRDMYQQRGPYGANPYAGAGSLYPGDVYGQQVGGQFPDASGNYMGLHPGMQGAGGNTAGNAGAQGNANKGKGGAAGANNNAGAGAGPTQGMNPDQHAAGLLMNNGYGYVTPYGGRGGMEGWPGYPAAQGGGWGGMMPFPNTGSPTPLAGAGGFPQQGQGAQQGQGQQGQGQQNRGAGNNAGRLPTGNQGPW
jgi:hypothetical protein